MTAQLPLELQIGEDIGCRYALEQPDVVAGIGDDSRQGSRSGCLKVSKQPFCRNRVSR
jgi:hypothetical protein